MTNLRMGFFKLTHFILFSMLILVSALGHSAVTFVHTDHLGSVVAESNSGGTITKRFHYKPFGETIEAQQDDVGYTGHKHDVDIGLTYMQARYYDPVLGRFLSNDPVGFLGHLQRGNSPAHGFNRYAYANNNPYKYTDPNGEFAIVAAIPWAYAAIKSALFVGSAGAVAYGASEALNAYNESSEGSEGTRELGDLEPIHDPDHPQNDPEIGELSDEGLGEAINNPEDGEKVKVRGNTVIDGNTRINEAKGRGWADDTEIPVIEFPERPDNIDDDPLGPYGG